MDEKELVGVCGAGHGNEHCEFRASSLKRSCEIFRFFYKMYGVEILNSSRAPSDTYTSGRGPYFEPQGDRRL